MSRLNQSTEGNKARSLGLIPDEVHPRRVVFFDKLQFRLARKLGPPQLRLLKDNAAEAYVRPGHPIRGRKERWLLVVVCPNKRALRFIAERDQMLVNYAEVALDLVVENKSAKRALERLFDEHFVQRWHRSQQTVKIGEGTYTGQRGAAHRFAFYADRCCKRTGDPHCLHLEGRHAGAPAVRAIGIHSPADLVAFDHHAYWQRNLRLEAVDLDRLGRSQLNRQECQRRQKSLRQHFGPMIYNMDRRMGALLFRHFSQPENFEWQPGNVQRFVDRYGRGPYMVQLDVSRFLPIPAFF